MRNATCLLLLILFPALAADISGTWDFTVNTDAGSGNPVFTFQQQGERLTGTYKGMLGEAKVFGVVKGDKVEFSFETDFNGEKLKIAYSGVIESATAMKGKATFAGMGEGAWTATKK